MKIMLNQLRRIIKEEVQKTMNEMGAPRAKLPGALTKTQKQAFADETGIDLDDKDYPYTWDETTETLSLEWDEAEPGDVQQYTKYKWHANEAYWDEVYEEDDEAAEVPGALPGQVPDPEELKLAMVKAYGSARAYIPVPGNPNMVLVKSGKSPGQFWPWEYEAFGPYRGWDQGDGPVDEMGAPWKEKGVEDSLKLGDIYRNPKGNQISIEFLAGDAAAWELLVSGRRKSVRGTIKKLKSVLMNGEFELDRNETAY